MSWDGTFAHTVAYSLDIAGALLGFNTADITISGMCRVVQLSDSQASGNPGPDPHDWPARLGVLKLWGWQVAILRWLAPRLDRIQRGHCELARQADIERAKKILTVLY